jgi:hypothetical protein
MGSVRASCAPPQPLPKGGEQENFEQTGVLCSLPLAQQTPSAIENVGDVESEFPQRHVAWG